MARLWNADSSLQFPSKPTLTGVYHDPGVGLQFVWHQGHEMWKRDTSKDYEKEIDGDLYQFKASRHLARRTVIRCEIRPKSELAAIFVQLPDQQEHSGVLKTVETTVKPVVDLGNTKYPVSEAIKALDNMVLNGQKQNGNVKGKRIGLISGGGGVSFHGHHDVPAVRHVRYAVEPSKFAGQHGEFTFRLSAQSGTPLEVGVRLNGELYRSHIRSQLTREEVWEALQLICQF